MAQIAPDSEDKLKAAWGRFNARVAKIRMKTKDLLKTVDERKREKEIEELRRQIGRS